MAIGIFSHVFIAIVLGVAISYYIYFSGTNFAVLKGAGFSLITVFIVLGIIFPLRKLALEMQDSPGDVLSAFIDHTVFGALSGYLVAYLQNKTAARFDKNDSPAGSYKTKKFHITAEMKKLDRKSVV